jgi:FkbM family methyltransferase
MTHIRSVVRYIWNEPSNQNQRAQRLAQGMLWQLRKRVCRRPVPVRLWNGRLFLADPADSAASFAFYARVLHSEHTLFVARTAGEGAMVDVGANVGLFALQLSHRFREAVLYEPSALAARKAQENMIRNGLDRYRVKALAVSDRPGRVKFASRDATGLDSRIVDDEETALGATTEVSATTLDEDIAPALKSRLSFLKIDVEGAEARVLAGARETLAAAPDLLIMFERLKRTPLAPVERLLHESGYTIFALTNGLPDRSERAIAVAHDLFACRSERLDNILRLAGTT